MTGMGKTFIYDRMKEGSFPKQIHQVPILINDSVLLARLLCSSLGTSRGRGEVMNRLILLPSTELVSYLYAVLGCCHGG